MTKVILALSQLALGLLSIVLKNIIAYQNSKDTTSQYFVDSEKLLVKFENSLVYQETFS